MRELAAPTLRHTYGIWTLNPARYGDFIVFSLVEGLHKVIFNLCGFLVFGLVFFVGAVLLLIPFRRRHIFALCGYFFKYKFCFAVQDFHLSKRQRL